MAVNTQEINDIIDEIEVTLNRAYWTIETPDYPSRIQTIKDKEDF